MVCNCLSEMSESTLHCGRPRSHSEPLQRQTRRNSIVLTPAVLNEYARGGEDAAMFKRQYEQAYFNVYGSPTPLNNVAATDVTLPWSDQTVYSRYHSDPRLYALGFFDVRRRSASRCSSNTWIIFTADAGVWPYCSTFIKESLIENEGLKLLFRTIRCLPQKKKK